MRKKLRVSFINPPHADWCLANMTTWICIQSHYQKYGHFRDQVEWVEPPYQFDVYSSANEIAQLVKDCDLVLFSSYIWNYDICDQVCQELTKLNSKQVRILGGPHIGTKDPDFFRTRPQYNYICQPTKSGEAFFESLVNLYFQNENWPERHLVEWELSSVVEGRRIDLPEYSIYRESFDFLKKLNLYAKSKGLEPFIVLEATRGCPFTCVYCEWGGGTNSKVQQRSLDVTKEDILALVEAGYNTAFLSDANFGLFEARDIELFRFALERDFALTDISTVKSTNYERRKRLVDAWFEIVGNKNSKVFHEPVDKSKALSGVETHLINTLPSVSLQSISDQAMKVAKRVDLSFEQKLNLSRHIHDRCQKEGYPPPPLELILGMPGSTLDDFYDEMQILWNFKSWNSFRHDYMFLPDTELADPNYQKAYKIETVEVYTDLVDEECIDNKHTLYTNKKNHFKTIRSCYSFTREEYLEMFFMNLAGAYLLRHFYETFEKDLSPPDFSRLCYKILKTVPGFEEIHLEIKDLLNPDTPPRSIKRLQGRIRGEVVIELIEKNRNILISEIFQEVHCGHFNRRASREEESPRP